MKLPILKKFKPSLQSVLMIIVGLVAVLVVVVVVDYRRLRQQHTPTGHGSLLSALHERRTMSANDAQLVQTWMTFSYLNHLFALPSSYLQTTLGISDRHYPYLTITRYAKDINVNQEVALARVRDALRASFATSQ